MGTLELDIAADGGRAGAATGGRASRTVDELNACVPDAGAPRRACEAYASSEWHIVIFDVTAPC
jgi:hypothetical protein